MGAWGYGPFENDTALDYYSMLKDCNTEGINAFLWMALDSKHEENVTLAIAIIGLIHNGKDDKLFFGADEQCTDHIIKTAKKNDILKKEALHKVKALSLEHDCMWVNWKSRKEILKLLEEKLI